MHGPSSNNPLTGTGLSSDSEEEDEGDAGGVRTTPREAVDNTKQMPISV